MLFYGLMFFENQHLSKCKNTYIQHYISTYQILNSDKSMWEISSKDYYFK